MSASTSKSYTACVLKGPKEMTVEKRMTTPPAPGSATIRILATGLCGSDNHYYIHGRNGTFVLQSPLVLGHEAGGVIATLPDDYEGEFKVGDNVAIEAGVNCGSCQYDRQGRYNLCKEMSFCSSAKTYPHRDGTLQEYMNHPIQYLHRMPDNVTYELASIAEPLSVVIQATRRAQAPQPGQSVLILGCGAVGLLSAALAKSMGATKITVVDIDQAKLDFCEAQGWATETVLLPRGPRVSGKESLEAAKKTVSELFEPKFGSDGWDCVFECSGVESCMQLSILLAKTGGKVVFVGMGTPEAMLPTANAFCREIDLIGVFRYTATYPAALSLLSSGTLGPGIAKMVTQRYSLEDAYKAFEDLSRGKDEKGEMVIKCMVGPDYE